MDARTKERIKVLRRKIAEARKQKTNARKAGQKSQYKDADEKGIRLEHELLGLLNPQRSDAPKPPVEKI